MPKDDPYASIAEDPYSSIAEFAGSPTESSPSPGFFKSLLGDLQGFLRPSAQNPYPGMGQQEKTEAAAESSAEDAARKKAGYSTFYRGVAPVGESIGVNVPGMEESAREGDVGGVLGHAAAVPVAIVSTEAAGAGLSKVGQLRESMQPFARKVTGVEPAVKEAVGKAAEQHADALAENASKRNEAAERDTLDRTIDEQSNKLGEHLTKVEESVSKEANRKFNALREKVGNPTVADPSKLVDTVKNIEAQTLQGIPENIKEFRSILAREQPPEGLAGKYEEATGFPLEGPEPMNWDYLQSIKSRIDARLRAARGRAMNGDLKRGLYQLRDAVVGEMGDLAEPKAPGEWKAARDFYRQYKEDFAEPTGPSGSGSPVAQSLNAVDPKNIRQPFISKQATTGNRAVEILRRYPEHGGNEAAAHAQDLLGNVEKRKGYSSKPAPKVPESPTVDVRKVAQEAIAKRAANWGTFNARDVGILFSSVLAEPIMKLLGGNVEGASSLLPAAAVAYEGGKFASSRTLNKPTVIDWLSKTPPEEVAVLSKIPNVDKVKITDGITQIALDSKAPVRLSPAAREFLGPKNVARIIAATGKPSTTVKNRKDALTALGR